MPPYLGPSNENAVTQQMKRIDVCEVHVRLQELVFGKLTRRDNSELEDLFPYIDFVNEPASTCCCV